MHTSRPPHLHCILKSQLHTVAKMGAFNIAGYVTLNSNENRLCTNHDCLTLAFDLQIENPLIVRKLNMHI